MKKKSVPFIDTQKHRKKIGDFLVCQNIMRKTHPLHQHDFYEFEYITEGEGIHFINDESYPVKKGELLFITPMDFHGYETENIKTITCHFYLKDMSPQIARLLSGLKAVAIKNVSPKTVGDLEYLYKIFKADGDYALLQLKNVIEIIVLDLFEDTKAVSASAYKSDVISEAIGYININFREDITLTAIEQKFHVSPSYFSREFKKRTGVCFTDYLADKRFDYAKKLLKNGNRVIDACLESGFGGVRNFTRRFKELYGITPSEYAKQQNNS